MAKPKSAIEEFTPDPRLVDERGATSERLARGPHDVADGSGARRMLDCPLERQLRAKKIDEKQYRAGVKFRHHWYHSGMLAPIGSLDLNQVFGGDVFRGPMPKSEAQLFHRQQYRAACQRVGLRIELVLSDAICREVPLEDIGRKVGFSNDPQSRAAASALFYAGLEILADLWSE
jgi:hypothetical protein